MEKTAERNKNRDRTFFNCGEEHELRHAAGQYEKPEEVADFIRRECASGPIHYWTHAKLHDYLGQKGFMKKS